MNIDQVFELIRRNGVGQDLRCFFISFEDIENGRDHMSRVNNYKYNDGTIKIFIDRSHLEEHEKILENSPVCELLIKKDEPKGTQTVKLFCKFTETENRFIYIRVFNIKYINDEGKEVEYRIQAE